MYVVGEGCPSRSWAKPEGGLGALHRPSRDLARCAPGNPDPHLRWFSLRWWHKAELFLQPGWGPHPPTQRSPCLVPPWPLVSPLPLPSAVGLTLSRLQQRSSPQAHLQASKLGLCLGSSSASGPHLQAPDAQSPLPGPCGGQVPVRAKPSPPATLPRLQSPSRALGATSTGEPVGVTRHTHSPASSKDQPHE